jgi:hypothetical protein
VIIRNIFLEPDEDFSDEAASAVETSRCKSEPAFPAQETRLRFAGEKGRQISGSSFVTMAAIVKFPS